MIHECKFYALSSSTSSSLGSSFKSNVLIHLTFPFPIPQEDSLSSPASLPLTFVSFFTPPLGPTPASSAISIFKKIIENRLWY